MKECPAYTIGEAIKDYLFENKVVFCNLDICPYKKAFTTTLSGEKMTICKSDGLLKKIDFFKTNIVRKIRKLTNPEINSQPDFVGCDFSGMLNS